MIIICQLLIFSNLPEFLPKTPAGETSETVFPCRYAATYN